MTGTAHSDRIPTLDGLRAIAIIIVMIAHAFRNNDALLNLGHMGVLIFFALSGYLITTRLLVERRSSGRVSLRDFYLRRAFRILPPVLVYLGILSALGTMGLVVSDARAVRSALFFYANYIDVGAQGWYVRHFWSLSVEEHFYLFWPCLLLIFGAAKGWRTAACLALAISVWRLADYNGHFVEGLLHDPLLQGSQLRTDIIADTILWGCCLAFMNLTMGPAKSTAIAAYSAILLALLCAGTRMPFAPHDVGLQSTIGRQSSTLLIDLRMLVEHLLPAIMVGAVVACPAAPIGGLLELAPMRFIGKLSYSLYIWQQLFLGDPNGSRTSVLTGIAATFACAYLSYRFIEQPCIRFGRTVIAGRAPRTAVQSA